MNNCEIWASSDFCVDNGYDWFNATDRRDWDNWSVEACRAELARAGQPTDDETVLAVYRAMQDIIAEYDAFNQQVK